MAAAGMTQEAIAAYVGCDPQTLRKYFSRELQHGATFLEGMALQVLVARMKEGHAPSAKAVLEIARARRTMTTPRAGALGKKEQRKLDATRPAAAWGELLGDMPPRTN